MSSPGCNFTHSSVSSFIPIASVLQKDCLTGSSHSPSYITNNANAFRVDCDEVYMKDGINDESLDKVNNFTSDNKNITTTLISNKNDKAIVNCGRVKSYDADTLINKNITENCKGSFNCNSALNVKFDKDDNKVPDPCSVAHKKMFHYQREVLQQHMQKHFQSCSNKLQSDKLDTSNLIEGQQHISTSSNYFSNMPLHHEYIALNNYSTDQPNPIISAKTSSCSKKQNGLELFFSRRYFED